MEKFVALLEFLARSGPTVLVFVIAFMGMVVAGLALYVVLQAIRPGGKRGEAE